MSRRWSSLKRASRKLKVAKFMGGWEEIYTGKSKQNPHENL